MAPFTFYCLVILFMNLTYSEMKPVDKWYKRGHKSDHHRILAKNQARRIKRATIKNVTVTVSGTAVDKNETARNATVLSNGSAFEQIEKANRANVQRYFQGDIDLEGDDELKEYLKSGGNSRNAIRARKRLWTSRIIPLRIPPSLSHIRANVRKAMQEFNSRTCLRFVDYVPGHHKNYIEFANTNGCSSRVGKKYFEAGRQTISLGDGCNFIPTIIHEMMHAVGFFHEQARSDRDNYVKIYWENILEGFSDQFDKYDWRDIDKLGVSYDYQSIMHYGRLAFTKNGKPTIVAIGNENMDFETPDGRLSTRDVIEINALYDCQTKTYGWATWSRWTPCDDDCYRTRERFCYNSGDVKACRGSGITNIYGVDRQRTKCPSSICPAPVSGHWGRWSEWQSCSKTCDNGVRTRVRKCDNPTPAHGGKTCAGSGSEQSPCIIKRCHLDADDTDFENFRMGMWTQSRADTLDWQFNRGMTQTGSTGPVKDHTSGSGYYLYLESSTPRRAGQKADLISPWMSAKPAGQCLKFYYTMYGRTMGSLDVKLELSDGISWLIFLKKGDQGEGWKKGLGNIDIPKGFSYRLIIEAKIGQPGYSDIAIDDVYIDPGLCNCQDEFVSCKTWVSRGDCTTRPAWMKLNCKRSCNACPPVDGQWSRWSDWRSCSKTCDNGVRTRARKCENPAPAYGGKPCPGSASDQSLCIMKRCHLDADDTDFESFRLGMWSQPRADGFDWQFKNGFTQTMNTGPMKDHTTGSGYYLYLESSAPRRAGQKADLISPWMSAKPGGQCLKFYYTMYGRTMGSLDVKLELKHKGAISAWLIFLKKGDQGKDWKKGHGNINVPIGSSYRLVIEGRIGQPGYSDIAIDDVYMDPGLCKCQDEFVSCKTWAGNGDCTTKEAWMKLNCRRSCEICGCVDSDKNQCPLWAKRGECQKNPHWMTKNCAKSCKTCGNAPVDGQWSRWSEWQSCSKTCDNGVRTRVRKCDNPSPAYGGKPCPHSASDQSPCIIKKCHLDCKDKNKYCPAWANRGECKKNPAYMLPNCKLSCGKCS